MNPGEIRHDGPSRGPSSLPRRRRAWLALSLSAALACAASGPGRAAEQTLVRSARGVLAGVPDGDVVRYLGIRFAAPPMGARRWAAPQPVTPWSGVYVADRPGPSCPQARREGRTSEDCLFLNVWVPRDRNASRLPVMVWAYGGGFVAGAGSDPTFDGAALARRGVIVVSFNYRLGTLGFLAHPQLSAESPARTSGNYGLLDAIAALEWVRENIAAFGGDPKRVTAFGESSGAMLLTGALLSPRARGLFQQVVLQSGGQMREYHGLAAAERLGAKLGDVASLRGIEPARLAPLSSLEVATFPRPLFKPRMSGLIADGKLLPEQQRTAFEEGRFHRMPMILGNNSDEGSYVTRGYPVRTVDRYLEYLRSPAIYGQAADEALRLYPAAADADVPAAVAMGFGDAQYHFGTRGVARAMAGTGAPVYRYLFTRRAGGVAPGPNHGDEVPYVMDNLSASERQRYDDDDHRLARAMADAWVRFAKTGNPNGAGLPEWPRYDAARDSYLEFGDGIRARAGYRSEHLDFVSRVQPLLKQ